MLCIISCFYLGPPTKVAFDWCRGEHGQLRVGVRRLARQQSPMPSSVISSQSMHLGVLATASHAVMTRTMFLVYYKPRFVKKKLIWCNVDVMSIAYSPTICVTLPLNMSFDPFRTSQFIVGLNKYLEAVNNKFSLGMRFKMRFEGDDSPERRYSCKQLLFCSKCYLPCQLVLNYCAIIWSDFPVLLLGLETCLQGGQILSGAHWRLNIILNNPFKNPFTLKLIVCIHFSLCMIFFAI